MSGIKCPNIKIYKCSDGFVTDNEQVAKSHEINIKNKKLLCPFCGQELTVYEYSAFTNVGFLPCEKCRIEGTKEMWETLIRTRKALEIAVDALKYANKCIKGGCVNWETEIDRALNKITALEQKD